MLQTGKDRGHEHVYTKLEAVLAGWYAKVVEELAADKFDSADGLSEGIDNALDAAFAVCKDTPDLFKAAGRELEKHVQCLANGQSVLTVSF